MLTWEARISILASVHAEILRLLTAGAVLNETLQTFDVCMLVCDVVLQLLYQCNQIVDSAQQVLYLGKTRKDGER